MRKSHLYSHPINVEDQTALDLGTPGLACKAKRDLCLGHMSIMYLREYWCW